MVHHFKVPDQLYGVTTPLWDFVFGTWPRQAP
jgi:sterol desaturase/sphingolipid hydroxylase (fatty acid hydroxylase superfamily)